MKYTLGKEERLKSKKLIEKLYKDGKSVKSFPLRLVYVQTDHTSSFPAQMGVSVAKRNFKLAVKRNRIKRLMKECYRLQKNIVYNQLDMPYVFMISYIGKEEITYDELFGKMTLLLKKFISEINTNKNESN